VPSTRGVQDRLKRRARKAGVALDPVLARGLGSYFEFLARWNAKINLTAFNLSEPTDEAIDRLLIEPVVAARHIPPAVVHAIDVGSGSGSPAIPLKLARPTLSLVMVEAKTRKAVFLLEAARHLGLNSASVETARFENLLTRPDLHEGFDALTIRAVRVEPRVLLSLQAFLKPGGEIYWFRGLPRGSGADAPYPLVWDRTVVLLEERGSGLVVLKKDRR
jgi:16S rRNA (guanine527-N7)-methyltransferase